MVTLHALGAQDKVMEINVQQCILASQIAMQLTRSLAMKSGIGIQVIMVLAFVLQLATLGHQLQSGHYVA